jgi:hypothetical protein
MTIRHTIGGGCRGGQNLAGIISQGIKIVTMNKEIWITHLLILTCLILSLMLGCTTPTTPPVTNEGEQSKEHPASDISLGAPDKVEVVYFHRAQRCYSCRYAEEGTRYTVETYFKDELANGKVIFKVLNVEDEKNAAIVKKYDAFTSSLFINTVRDGTEHIEEVTDIWLVLDDDKAFVEVVRGKIEKSLKKEV